MDILSQFKRSLGWIAVGIALLVAMAYYPVLGNGFVNYDDPSYVTANSMVKGGLSLEAVRWAFTTLYFYNWHPLTWLSHMLDVQIFGLLPAGHHLTSLILHLGNTILLFALFRMGTGSMLRSALVAALFALHPLHVEPVAWVSGRKDLLSTFFGILSMMAWIRYTRVPRLAPYLLCLFLFALSLTAKSMLITLPLLLLLLDFWPLERFRHASDTGVSLVRLLVEKLPFAALAGIAASITYHAQQQARELATGSSLLANASMALVNYVTYIFKMFWPFNLAVYYPYAAVSLWQAGLSLAAILVITAAAIFFARRFPWLACGWFWYLVTLGPVAGFIRVGQHAMADRYSYIPLIGLFIIVAWGGSDLAERLRLPPVATASVTAILLLVCAVISNVQAARWLDSVTLFTHALSVTDHNAVAHKNLGAALAKRGDLPGALHHVTESLRIQPEPLEYVSQAWLHLQLGNNAAAAQAARNSLAMLPANEKAHFILGLALLALHDVRSATIEYEQLQRTRSPYALELQKQIGLSGNRLGTSE